MGVFDILRRRGLELDEKAPGKKMLSPTLTLLQRLLAHILLLKPLRPMLPGTELGHGTTNSFHDEAFDQSNHRLGNEFDDTDDDDSDVDSSYDATDNDDDHDMDQDDSDVESRDDAMDDMDVESDDDAMHNSDAESGDYAMPIDDGHPINAEDDNNVPGHSHDQPADAMSIDDGHNINAEDDNNVPGHGHDQPAAESTTNRSSPLDFFTDKPPTIIGSIRMREADDEFNSTIDPKDHVISWRIRIALNVPDWGSKSLATTFFENIPLLFSNTGNPKFSACHLLALPKVPSSLQLWGVYIDIPTKDSRGELVGAYVGSGTGSLNKSSESRAIGIASKVHTHERISAGTIKADGGAHHRFIQQKAISTNIRVLSLSTISEAAYIPCLVTEALITLYLNNLEPGPEDKSKCFRTPAIDQFMRSLRDIRGRVQHFWLAQGNVDKCTYPGRDFVVPPGLPFYRRKTTANRTERVAWGWASDTLCKEHFKAGRDACGEPWSRTPKAEAYRQRPDVVAKKRAYLREYRAKPEVRAKDTACQQRSEVKAKAKANRQKLEVKARLQENNKRHKQGATHKRYYETVDKLRCPQARQDPDVRAKQQAYMKEYKQRPEVKAREAARQRRPEAKAKAKAE
ncbi:hypothetical protein QBC37DRAFT_405954 [Rhypophila decipiens]|uniref:Uncharacterized protein n=1 Tax=Rhypophila decipiens TaxID=261697 RepID=A0AAN6Y037_9PEZI|nr:hypothetical protein QBC37DRAFT_405954 [Rhypophila decipiens]